MELSPVSPQHAFASLPPSPPPATGADHSGSAKGSGNGMKLLVAVLSLCLLIFVALFAWKAHEAATSDSTVVVSPSGPATPPSPAVVSATLDSWIRSAMDTTADPCEDFFQYTCGGYLRTHPLPADAAHSDTRSFNSASNISSSDFQRVLDDQFSEAGQYMRACMQWDNVTSADPRAARSLQSLDRWLQLIDQHFSLSAPSYADLWYLIGVLHGQGLSVGHLLFSLGLAQRYSADTGTALPDSVHRELQFEMTIEWSSRVHDNAAMVPVAILEPWIDSVQQDLIAAGLSARLYDAASFTPVTIAELMQNQSELFASWQNFSAPSTLFNLTTLELSGDVISSSYLRGVGNHSFAPMYAGVTTYPLDEWTGYADHIVDVVITDTAYMTQLGAYVRGSFEGCAGGDAGACERLAILRSALKLNLVASLLPALPSKYSSALADAGLPIPWIPSREDYCKGELMTDFNNILYNEAFVRAFSPATTDAMVDLVSRIYNALGATLLDTAWLDQSTKTRALNKWALMTKNIAYDTTWNNLLFGVEISGQWELDLVAAHSYRHQRMLWVCDLPFDVRTPQLVGMTPWTQNAYYMAPLNSINMLPGLMLFPLFDPANPMMLNIAQYGWVIGHELIHGFDNNGRQYDAVGQFNNWWSPQAVAEFGSRAQCLVDQYDALRVKANGTTFPVLGSQTLGENIADNGGIGLAWRAYRSLYASAATNLTAPLMTGFSNDQLFWVMASQVWCTADNAHTAAPRTDVHAQPQVRAYAPFANRPEFAAAFQCAPSSYMGRSLTADKCQIW